MSKRTRKIITILLLVAAFAPLRNNPKAPPTISQKEYEEIVKPAIRKSIHPSWGLPKEERVLLKVRTGFDFGGRSLLGIDIHFTSYRGHSIAVIPTYLAECFIEIDGEAWISKNELPILERLFSTELANQASLTTPEAVPPTS
jgi:hypothetical protein